MGIHNETLLKAMRLTPKRVVLFSIIALIVLVIGFLSLSVFGPSTPIIVSRETTYLTEPLDQWGNVDYVEAIRRQWSDGVTPENNAAALIWQALGPAEIPIERRSAFFTKLGIAPLPEEGDYFVEINQAETVKQQAIDWIRIQEAEADEGMPPDPDASVAGAEWEYGRVTADVDTFDRFVQLTERTRRTPWRAEEIPPLAGWLEQIQTPLELTVQASMRTKYYSPVMIDDGPTGVGGLLISMLLSDVQHCRGLARGLCHRAMLHLGEERPLESWQDLQAMHRLARLIGRQGPLVQQLVAIAIDQIALQADAALLHEGNLSARELRDIQNRLMQLSPPCNVSQSIGTFERLTILDALGFWAHNGVHDLGFGDFGSVLLSTRIDWNLPLQMANRWYDKLAAAMDHPTVAERRAAMEVVERELRTMESGIRSPGKLFGAIVSGSKRSEVVGEVMLALLLPATSAAQHAEDRSQASLQLLQVAAALAIHRAENGAYPDTLDEISADLRAELPVDPFTEKSFLYEKRGDGFVLWSVGQNLVNDKASGDRFFSTVGGEPAIDGQATRGNQDDIVLRVPWVEPTEANASDGS